jgi:hypothetical protein
VNEMNEQFKILDYRIFKKGDNKNAYLIMYSNLGYLVNVYVKKDSVELLEDIVKTDSFEDYDFLSHITKTYRNDTKTFTYFWGE